MFMTRITTLLLTLTTSISIFSLSTPPKNDYHKQFLTSISTSSSANESISNHLYILTRRPHIAGSEANAEAADYVRNTLASYSIPSHLVTYRTALTHPFSRSLVLTPQPLGQPLEFDLKQEVYRDDPYADVSDQVAPTFHAYAKSGTAVGPVVYVNYGRVEDYATLKEMGVNVTGNVALAKYGMIFRGDIVGNAYQAGAIGVIIYSDKKDYGGGWGKDAKWFPDAKWMPPSGVQVGSVFRGTGDPTTPGWPSIDECERVSEEAIEKSGDVPLIPSLPVSGDDGDLIVRSIGGQVAADDWQGGKDAPVYRVGPGPAVVNLTYQGKLEITKIENVIGIIEGSEEPDRYIILGNHRDAWTFGAADPNSGTACLLEVARRLSKLQENGWKPRRTIMFCNWDAEEYGLIGSTEWVEDNVQMLYSRAVAYLNVDVAVAEAGFTAFATPQLDELLIQVAKQVVNPDNSSQTVYDSWVGSATGPVIGRLGGGGSDYKAFVQHIGVPSTDMVFGRGYPVYHSMYDDFVWMKNFGDPQFQRHVAMTSVWGLLALKLADEEILPFNYLSYAQELQKSAGELASEVSNHTVNLDPLNKSIEELKNAATYINNEIKSLDGSKSWASISKDRQKKVRELNDRLMMAERAFTDRDGLKQRPWYKHLIYAPSRTNVYGSKSFPGIHDAIDEANKVNTTNSWRSVQHEIYRVARAIRQVSLCLKGELT